MEFMEGESLIDKATYQNFQKWLFPSLSKRKNNDKEYKNVSLTGSSSFV